MSQLPPLTADGRRQRAALANAKRLHPDSPVAEAAERRFKATRLTDYIRHQMESAPALTLEQRAELAAILRPTPTAGGNTR